MCIYTCMCKCNCLYINVNVHIPYTCTCIYVYVIGHMYTCICMCLHGHTHTQTHLCDLYGPFSSFGHVSLSLAHYHITSLRSRTCWGRLSRRQSFQKGRWSRLVLPVCLSFLFHFLHSHFTPLLTRVVLKKKE